LLRKFGQFILLSKDSKAKPVLNIFHYIRILK